MKRLLVGLIPLLMLACTKQGPPLKEATVAEVAEHLKNGTATVFDANDDEYRKAVGTLPGAVLLTSYREYDVATTLPADKERPCIFYCTSRT